MRNLVKFIALSLAVGIASVASAQAVYSIFSPNGGLAGDWQYQYLQLGAPSYLNGTLGSLNGGTGVSSAPDDQTLIGNGSSFVQTTIPGCLDSGGNHLNYNASTNALSCGTTAGGFSGSTASLGGGLLAAGGCSTVNTTVTGATTSMAAVATPTTFPGNGNTWMARVSAADTVTVYLCAMVLGTPTASTYNVRVIP